MKEFNTRAIVLLINLIFACSTVYAQMSAPNVSPAIVAPPSNDMILETKGGKLEVLLNQRAIPTANRSRFNIEKNDNNDNFSTKNLGIVYNHSLKMKGFLTGEISFKIKNGTQISSLSNANLSGAKLLVPPDVYVINANNGKELIGIFKWLASSPAIEWVEPFVIYGVQN